VHISSHETGAPRAVYPLWQCHQCRKEADGK